MMMRLRTAFNPDNRCSPGKMLPTAGACIEPSKAGRRAALRRGFAHSDSILRDLAQPLSHR